MTMLEPTTAHRRPTNILHDRGGGLQIMFAFAAVPLLAIIGLAVDHGYAVMVKVAPDAGPNGEGWYWYERLGQTVYADGTAVGLCSGCHMPGKDNILTPFPLQ